MKLLLVINRTKVDFLCTIYDLEVKLQPIANWDGPVRTRWRIRTSESELESLCRTIDQGIEYLVLLSWLEQYCNLECALNVRRIGSSLHLHFGSILGAIYSSSKNRCLIRMVTSFERASSGMAMVSMFSLKECCDGNKTSLMLKLTLLVLTNGSMLDSLVKRWRIELKVAGTKYQYYVSMSSSHQFHRNYVDA